MGTKPGIMFINSSPILGGTERWMLLTAAAMQRRGFPVTIGYRYALMKEYAEEAGLPHIHLPLKNDADIFSVFRIALHARKNHFSVVIPTKVKEYWLGTLGAKLAGMKSLIFLGIVRSIQNKWKNRKLYGKWADAILVNAESIRKTLLESAFIPPAKILFLPNGISIPERLPEFRPAPRPFRFIYVGSLIPRKNVTLLLKCFKKLKDELPEIPLELEYLGDGPERPALERMCQKFGLNGSVKLRGHQKEVEPFLLEADACVLLSQNEGFPNTVVEAMAYGVPVLATRVAGLGEVLTDMENVLLVNPDTDERAIVEKMKTLVFQPEMRARLREKAFLIVKEKFSLEKMTDILENQIGSILNA